MRPNPKHFQIIFWHSPCSFGISAVIDLKGLTSSEPGAKGTLTCKSIRLPFQDSIDPALDELFKDYQPRPETKAARERFLKMEIFKKTFELLARDERAEALAMFEIEYSGAFGATPWHCHFEDVDALCKARRAALKRTGSSRHLYLLTALWDNVFSHMENDKAREEWLADHWQIKYPEGEAVKKQIQKLNLPRSPGAYGVRLRKEEHSERSS
jgi:hypothetical protein